MVAMLNPIYVVAAGLAAAFMVTLFHTRERLSYFIMISALSLMLLISLSHLASFLAETGETVQVFTAGFVPPFSINFQMGPPEALLTAIVSFVGLLSGISLSERLRKTGAYAQAVYIVLVMGMNVMILTRDLFNLFVFLEIVSIATVGILSLSRSRNSVNTGFTYMVASGLISVVLLIGIVFAYMNAGSLNIDTLSASAVMAGRGGSIAVLLIILAFLLELKPFPANGWGIDLYSSAPGALSALISAGGMSATYYALAKVLPVGQWSHASLVAPVGGLTFIASQIIALKQENGRRLLGYSSIGQIGLLLVVLGFSETLGDKRDFIAAGLLITHALSKAILFYISDIVKDDSLKGWAALRKKPVLLILFGVAAFALIGFPPFPSFFAKWDLILLLNAGTQGHFLLSAMILAGSLIEAVYLFRWFSYALKLPYEDLPELSLSASRLIAPVAAGLVLAGASWYVSTLMNGFSQSFLIPVAFILLVAVLDRLPAWSKNVISIAGVSLYIIDLYPRIAGDLMTMIFAGIFLVGAVLTLLSGFYYKGRRAGFYPMALTMFAGLAALIEAATLLEFFWGWELMAIGSYFLLIRGKKSMPHGLSYLLFSIGGSYAILYGFSLAAASAGGAVAMSSLAGITVMPALAYSLMLLGFLTKTASIGVHIWLPGAHGEAVADIHFMASAILLKAGVFGLITVLLAMGSEAEYTRWILLALGWIGVLSALLGNISAAFQESAKRLLAWSSIGQLGYIVWGLASMSHLGWLIALGYSVTHFLYKGILFLAIGGIALKIGTPYMYRMGGLIKRMPYSFFAVLIAIITLSGVPPLVGFSAKWITYNLIISEQLYYQGFVILIAGIIAFLYLFRMIYTIFLGQLKDNLRSVGEISIWFRIPMYILLIVILVLSLLPNTLLRPIGEMLSGIFPEGAIVWTGARGVTTLGYFDGAMIMYVISGIFAVLTIVFLLLRKQTQKVKQFNIFYSGEAPSRPELSHFSYNFFAHYRKAVGALALPMVTGFWAWVTEIIHAVSDFIRRIYTGNGQTYLFHIVLYVVVVFLVQSGGYR